MGWRGDHTTNRLKRKLATEPEKYPKASKKSCKTLVQKLWYRTNTFVGFLHHEDWLRARLHRCPGNPPATGCAHTRQVQSHLSGEGIRGHRRPAGAGTAARSRAAG